MPVPFAYTLTLALVSVTVVAPGLLAMTTAPGGMIFVYVVAGAPPGVVTLTVIVQEELGGIVPPVKVTVVPVFVAVPAIQVVVAELTT